MPMFLQFYDESDQEAVDVFAFDTIEDLQAIKRNADRFYLKDKCIFRIVDSHKQPVASMRFLSDVELFFTHMMGSNSPLLH